MIIDAFSTGAQATGRWLKLQLVQGKHRFQALIVGDYRNQIPEELLHSDLRIRGVYGAIFNDHRDLIGTNILVASLDQVEVLDQGLQNAFTQTAVAVQDLRQFRPGTLERALVKGVVTWSESGQGFTLADPSGPLWVDPVEAGVPKVGTSISVVGFPSIGERSLRLRDAVYRTTNNHLTPPEPQLLDASSLHLDALQGNLVNVEAQVVDRLALPHTQVLVLARGPHTFQARYPASISQVRFPATGSWVSVCGVYRDIFTKDSATNPAFEILLRAPGDVILLRSRPWWTIERIAWLAGVLCLVGFAAFTWAITLRRRVASQTQIISQQIESHRVALERARIGRELHDTLEQHLTGVAMQIDAAQSNLPKDASLVHKALTLALAMLNHSRQEARHSVWNLQSPLLQQEGLPGALRHLAESMSTEQTQVTCLTPDTWHRLDSDVEFHLLRIAQEATANAIKHADANLIQLRLEQSLPHTRLVIRDDGKGFEPGKASQSGDGVSCFGLASLQERAGKLKARLEIRSQPGEGTSIELQLSTVPE